jgi:hypothetical protein
MHTDENLIEIATYMLGGKQPDRTGEVMNRTLLGQLMFQPESINV